MSLISYNPNAANARTQYEIAMGAQSEGIERGGNVASVQQGVRAASYHVATKKAVVTANDLIMGGVVAAVVFGVCAVLMGLGII